MNGHRWPCSYPRRQQCRQGPRRYEEGLRKPCDPSNDQWYWLLREVRSGPHLYRSYEEVTYRLWRWRPVLACLNGLSWRQQGRSCTVTDLAPESPTYIDIPGLMGTRRVELGYLRELLAVHGYDVTRVKEGAVPERASEPSTAPLTEPRLQPLFFRGVEPDSDDWAIGRLVELRQQGEQARVRICWRDRGRHRFYWMQIRRADGTLESPPRVRPEPGDRSTELQELAAARVVAEQMQRATLEAAPVAASQPRPPVTFDEEKLDLERRQFVRSAVIVLAAHAKLAGEVELVDDALRLWAALRAVGC